MFSVSKSFFFFTRAFLLRIYPDEEADPIDRKCRMTLINSSGNVQDSQFFPSTNHVVSDSSSSRDSLSKGSVIGRDLLGFPCSSAVCVIWNGTLRVFFSFSFYLFIYLFHQVQCHVAGSLRALTGDAMIGPKAIPCFALLIGTCGLQLSLVYGAVYGDYIFNIYTS